jgi:hypothetical protein
LRIEADGGHSEDMLLREIRRHRPGCATAMLWIDRQQLPRFLQKTSSNWRRVLQGSDTLLYDDGPRSYVDWYAAQWQGASIEIAMAPGGYRNGFAIAFSDEGELANQLRTRTARLR